MWKRGKRGSYSVRASLFLKERRKPRLSYSTAWCVFPIVYA